MDVMHEAYSERFMFHLDNHHNGCDVTYLDNFSVY